jgi:hypothetical protein
MADDAEKTEEHIIFNGQETSSFSCAKAAMATKVKSFQDFSRFF